MGRRLFSRQKLHIEMSLARGVFVAGHAINVTINTNCGRSGKLKSRRVMWVRECHEDDSDEVTTTSAGKERVFCETPASVTLGEQSPRGEASSRRRSTHEKSRIDSMDVTSLKVLGTDKPRALQATINFLMTLFQLVNRVICESS